MALEDAARQALAQFGFHGRDVERLEQLPQGVKNVNFRVRAADRDWVLKLHASPGAAERLMLTHRLETCLVEAGLPVARLHRPAAGGTFVATDAGTFTLHGWVDGHQISIGERDAVHASHPDLVRDLGQLLGDLHREGRQALADPDAGVPVESLLSAPARTVASIRHGRPHRFRKTARLRRNGGAFDRWVLSVLPGLFRDAALLASPRVAAILDPGDVILAHNDVNWENLVLDRDFAVLALLDFDNAAPLPRALDVGAAAAVLVGADEERLHRFLEAYALAFGTAVGRSAVHLGMRWKCVRSILWSVDAYVSGRVADVDLVAAWCRHLAVCWSELPPLSPAAGTTVAR
ncbi:phosphotransferase enzyme family protein [Nocardioides xinjiangensis]|uniref:phosphotransferase enzyme family protein n=1 Tax=Nocardioides xinjiangensis TaxID=2817376 RepID=UPI001B313D71|nr:MULTISPECIES: phosphotransferase [unclassified Nocardioides]